MRLRGYAPLAKGKANAPEVAREIKVPFSRVAPGSGCIRKHFFLADDGPRIVDRWRAPHGNYLLSKIFGRGPCRDNRSCFGSGPGHRQFPLRCGDFFATPGLGVVDGNSWRRRGLFAGWKSVAKRRSHRGLPPDRALDGHRARMFGVVDGHHGGRGHFDPKGSVSVWSVDQIHCLARDQWVYHLDCDQDHAHPDFGLFWSAG